MGKNVKSKYRKLHLIFRFLDGSKAYFALAVVASLLSTLLNALTPQIFRFSIDEVLSGDKNRYLSDNLWILALMIVAVAVGSGIFTYISRTNTARAGENFAKNLRDTLFVHVQKLPMKWHDRNQTGDIIQQYTSDVEVIRGFVVTQLLEVFRTAFLVIISFVMMFSMNVKLSLIVMLFIPVVIVYSTVFYLSLIHICSRKRGMMPGSRLHSERNRTDGIDILGGRYIMIVPPFLCKKSTWIL